jgi:hypothetical protein
MWRDTPESPTLVAAKADRLRHAILRLVVEEIGQTVDETLREMCEKLDDEGADQYARCVLLRRHLELRGLQFMAAIDYMNLDSKGYLMLVDAKRLLARYPGLAAWRPEEHDLLTIGELPQSLRPVASLGSDLSVLSPRSGGAEQLSLVRSSIGYCDVPGKSRWELESNKLRHSILALRLSNAGRTVKEVLNELCNLLEPHTDEQRDRIDDYQRSLEAVGLSFEESEEGDGLPIGGYILLTWPDRLLGHHPEFADLHPTLWSALRIA